MYFWLICNIFKHVPICFSCLGERCFVSFWVNLPFKSLKIKTYRCIMLSLFFHTHFCSPVEECGLLLRSRCRCRTLWYQNQLKQQNKQSDVRKTASCRCQTWSFGCYDSLKFHISSVTVNIGHTEAAWQGNGPSHNLFSLTSFNRSSETFQSKDTWICHQC